MIGYTAQFYNKTANIVIFLLFSWALSYVRTITRSHGIGVTSVVRETPQVNGRRQSYPSHYTHTPTDMSRNIAYVITSTIYSHATFGQDRPRSYFSPYCHPIFFISLYANQGHDIIQRQITEKGYQIELYLQWRTAQFSMTLNNP